MTIALSCIAIYARVGGANLGALFGRLLCFWNDQSRPLDLSHSAFLGGRRDAYSVIGGTSEAQQPQ